MTQRDSIASTLDRCSESTDLQLSKGVRKEIDRPFLWEKKMPHCPFILHVEDLCLLIVKRSQEGGL